MTLVVETGAVVPYANSYVSLAYANTYFASHPFYADAWDALQDDRKENLLIAASRQLDVEFAWRGYAVSLDQPLGWPRLGVRDNYDAVVSGSAVPQRVQQATCEMAYYLSKGDPSPEASTSTGLDKLKIDVIELDFGSSTKLPTVSSTVRNLLRGLGDYQGGIRVRKVLVG